MTKYYEKIPWDINLEKYLCSLEAIGITSASNNNLNLPKELVFKLIAELAQLNQLLLLQQYKIISISIVNTNPKIFGGIHVDKTRSGRPLELRLNIPLENSTEMVNRWYDISKTPYPIIYWDYTPKKLTDGDRWFLENKDTMIDKFCLDTLVLTTPTFFKSSVPHNVDGSESFVRRRILSIVFSNSKLDRIADWCERHVILDCINKL